MVTFLVFLLNFIDYHIGLLSIGEISLMLLMLLAFFNSTASIGRTSERISILGMILCMGWSFVANLFADHFDLVEFCLTFFKFIIYVCAIYVVYPYLIKVRVNIQKIINVYIVIAVVAALYQYVAVRVFGREKWILYGLGGHLFGIEGDAGMFNIVGKMRARSFYSEPAHFAIHISMLFGILLLTGYVKGKRNYLHLFYVVAMVSANSMSGYAIVIVLYVLYFVRLTNYKEIVQTFGIFLIGIVGGILLIFSNDYLYNRLIGILQGKDGSASVRTVEGFKFLAYTPWYGVGVGNQRTFFDSISSGYVGLLEGEFYNNIVLAIITIGYIGTLFFLLYQWGVFKKNRKVFWLLMIIHFAWGYLFAAPIWIFILIYKVIENNNEQLLLTDGT